MKCSSCNRFNNCLLKSDSVEQCSGYEEEESSRFVMVCVNNKGYEDHFDEGIGYDFNDIPLVPEPEFITVYDRFGEPKECFTNRFELGVED